MFFISFGLLETFISYNMLIFNLMTGKKFFLLCFIIAIIVFFCSFYWGFYIKEDTFLEQFLEVDSSILTNVKLI